MCPASDLVWLLPRDTFHLLSELPNFPADRIERRKESVGVGIGAETQGPVLARQVLHQPSEQRVTPQTTFLL